MNRKNGWEMNTQEKKEKIYNRLRRGRKNSGFSLWCAMYSSLCKRGVHCWCLL